MTKFAAVPQLLIAIAFLTIPLIRHRFGNVAKDAAEAELIRQGVSPTVLAENKLSFDAGGHETIVPATVAAVMITVAAFNLAGSQWGQTLTWIFQSIVLLGNLLILHSQLTAAKSVQAAFARKGDPMLQRIDVPALLTAAESGFPRWVFPVGQNIRHGIVLGGSVLALLAITFA
jgi:hypothetical protein